MSFVGLLVNLIGEVAGNIDFSGDPLGSYKRDYATLKLGVPDVDEQDWQYNYMNWNKAVDLNRDKKAVAIQRANEIRTRLEAAETKYYEDVAKKFEDNQTKALEAEYEKKNKELEEQYEQIMKELEEEYQKGYAENQDKFYGAEDTKIQKQKDNKKAFDDAILKNVENRMKFEASKKKVPGCNTTEQSEAKIRHDAFLEEKAKKEKAEEAEARGETPENSGGGKKQNKRAVIVKEIMVKKGLSMIEASKYVKQHNLY